MTRGIFFDADVGVDVHEVLQQQGLSFSAVHRATSLANDATQNYLFDVKSSMHVSFGLKSGADAFVSLASVTSYTVGAGTSMDVYNRNQFFEGVNSFSTLPFRSASVQAGSSGIFDDFFPGGIGVAAIGGAEQRKEMILKPGIYLFEVTNKGGAADHFGVHVHWEEPTIPNAP